MSQRIIIIIILYFLSLLLAPVFLPAQVLTHHILDLRTKTHFKSQHPWQFHPGDSPLLTSREKGDMNWRTGIQDLSSLDANLFVTDDDPALPPSLNFAWAQRKLENLSGWIDNFHVQLAWTRYQDAQGTRPFADFSQYQIKHHGYGWYRTTFVLSPEDLRHRFASRQLVLRLGKIGQADAVYLNGHFIGGTGLKPSSPRQSELDDSRLYYNKIRFYQMPADLLDYNGENTLAVRVYAKYDIAPGLSHDKYYIASYRHTERSQFWDDFKKTFVIVLTLLLGLFYSYWQILFRNEERATMYFALASFAMAINTFMQSQIVYAIWQNALWIKKLEYISFIALVHLILLFVVKFARLRNRNIVWLDRFWNLLAALAMLTVVIISNLETVKNFMLFWGVLPFLLFGYLLYIIVKGRKIPAMGTIFAGVVVMALLLAHDALIAFQFRVITWEILLKDYAFALFAGSVAASIVSNMVKSKETIAQQKREKERLSRYFSPDVMKTIVSEDFTMGGQEKPIATLFADVVGFTAFSEKNPPAAVVKRLNIMFERLSAIIFKYNATLDKYIGDCIMAFWGAPNSTHKDALNCIACAMEMQTELRQLNQSMPSSDTAPFQLRIGVNYGPSIVGNIGSELRMDYTVIGDAVNTAARIESNGIAGHVAVSEAAYLAAGGDKHLRYSEVKQISVKGKTEPIRVYIISEIL